VLRTESDITQRTLQSPFATPFWESVANSEGSSSAVEADVESGDVASDRNHAILSQFLEECCLELMTHYGLPATRQAAVGLDELQPEVAMATIEFEGENLRGTIGLGMTRSVVVETYRSALGVMIRPDSMEAADWTCELVNQLIGRLKNKLRSYNVSFHVNPPSIASSSIASSTIMGSSLPQSERTIRARFVCAPGAFAGYLDMAITRGFALIDCPPEAPLLDEGELVLF
jgi:hypothetical protein